MTALEKWQQLLLVISLTAVVCVPVAGAWQLFLMWHERWCERSESSYVGPRQRQRIMRRRLKVVALVLVLVCMVTVTAPAPAREWRQEGPEVAPASEFAYAVNLAKMSPELGELRAYLLKYPDSARDILAAAGVDIGQFCERHQDLAPILMGGGSVAEW